jgi:hypothetical protein
VADHQRTSCTTSLLAVIQQPQRTGRILSYNSFVDDEATKELIAEKIILFVYTDRSLLLPEGLPVLFLHECEVTDDQVMLREVDIHFSFLLLVLISFSRYPLCVYNQCISKALAALSKDFSDYKSVGDKKTNVKVHKK